jgi:TolB-like protein/DNA-binding winged helix-turn-helix (wHTH) protein
MAGAILRAKSRPERVNTRLIKFAEFELDCARYELRRNGRVVKLEKIPMDLLIMLASSDGRLVTREAMEEEVWGKGVFVDAEHGINTAMRKVRQALGDDPEQPKFMQTVQRKGYRFIAEVKPVEEKHASDGTEIQAPATTEPAAPLRLHESGPGATEKANSSKRMWAWLVAAAAILLAWPAIKFVVPTLTRAEKEPAIRAIAVLPLENISGDAEQEFFADGMTDELITMLAKYPSLRVISRTSVMQYKGVHRPLPEIAKELGVDGIVEGSVTQANGRVLVRAQLIYAPRERHLWAESYDRDLGDVLSLQEELSRNIAERVNLAAALDGQGMNAKRAVKNQAARDAYHRGRTFWSAGQYKKSEDYFRQAIRLEPNYAEAYGGIADSYTASAVSGDVRPLDVKEKAEEAARKGVELDDQAAEVHHSMAAVKLFFEWNWDAAEKECERDLGLNPGIAELHHLHAYVLEAQNKIEEALKEDNLCVEMDPFGRPWAYGFALYRNRRYGEAIQEFVQRGELAPHGAYQHELLGLSYAHNGEHQNAMNEWKKRYEMEGRPEIAKKTEAAFEAKGISGVRELRFELEKAASREGYVSHLKLAEAAAQANHKAEALEHLEKAYEEREPLMVRLLHNPELDPLQAEPRFKALVKKLGLPGPE